MREDTDFDLPLNDLLDAMGPATIAVASLFVFQNIMVKTPSDSHPDLNDCPHCDRGEKVQMHSTDGSLNPLYYVVCDDPACQMRSAYGKDRREAAQIWNELTGSPNSKSLPHE